MRVTPTPGVTPDGWVSVGVIARAHGIKGALKLHLWNDDSDVLVAGLAVRIGKLDKRVARYASGVLELDGLSDRNVAETMQGHEVFVRRADFPAPEDSGEVYLVDLVGASVVDEKGGALGIIEGVTDNGAQPLLIVKRGAAEVLVPFVDAIVKEATRERVVLAPPAGLFDEDAIVDEREAPHDGRDARPTPEPAKAATPKKP